MSESLHAVARHAVALHAVARHVVALHAIALHAVARHVVALAIHAIAAGPVIAIRICSARVLAILTIHAARHPRPLLVLLVLPLLTIGTLDCAVRARDLNVVGPMTAVVLANGIATDTGKNDETGCGNATDCDQSFTGVTAGWRRRRRFGCGRDRFGRGRHGRLRHSCSSWLCAYGAI